MEAVIACLFAKRLLPTELALGTVITWRYIAVQLDVTRHPIGSSHCYLL